MNDEAQNEKTQTAIGVSRFFWVWAPALLLVVVVGAYSYISQTVTAIDRGVSNLHLEVAERASLEIEQSLMHYRSELNHLGTDVIGYPKDKEGALSNFMRENPEFDSLTYVSREGNTVIGKDRYDVPDKSNLQIIADREDVRTVMTSGMQMVGAVFISKRGEPLLSVVVPTSSFSGQAEGVLVADINLKFMWTLMQEIQADHTTNSMRVYVVDHDGNVIADPDSSVVLEGANLSTRPIVAKVLSEKKLVDGLDPSLRYTDAHGEVEFSVARIIPMYEWGVITEEPLSTALSASRRTAVVGTVFGVSIAALLIMLVMVIQRLIVSNRKTSVINETLDANNVILKKREVELTTVNDRLRELDQAKSEFISVAAHQLRTPLSAIKWTLSLLIDENAENLTSEQKSLLMKGNESNERIINLVNEMLVVTRIESGKMQYSFSTIHIEDLIDSILLDFTEQAITRNVTLTFDRPNPQLAYVNADPEKIRAVVQNLIENAFNYTLSGGTIMISEKAEAHGIRVLIQDSGIGIPEHQQASIFNKFFRADNAVKTKTDGSGLGLFVSKSIINKHGGELGFTSKEGVGSTFYFTVPYADIHP